MSAPSWSQRLTESERVYDMVKSTDGIEWLVNAGSGLLGICLFIAAGHRQKQGDYLGSVLSLFAAVLCALAPILAKLF